MNIDCWILGIVGLLKELTLQVFYAQLNKKVEYLDHYIGSYFPTLRAVKTNTSAWNN